jgi:hypothetical protein
MGSGSGTPAATAVVAAGGLDFGFGGGIVFSCNRSVEAYLSMVCGRPNKELGQRSPAARSCLLNHSDGRTRGYLA